MFADRVNTSKEDAFVPLSPSHLLTRSGNKSRNNRADDKPDPVDDNTNPDVSELHTERLDPRHEGENGEVANNQDHGRGLVKSVSIFLTVVPANSNRLQNTHKENSVNIEVVIKGVEKSEAPVKAEDSGSSCTNQTEESSDNQF